MDAEQRGADPDDGQEEHEEQDVAAGDEQGGRGEDVEELRDAGERDVAVHAEQRRDRHPGRGRRAARRRG